MLTDLIKSGFGVQEDLNCAEKIFYGSNQAYNLGLDKTALKAIAGFGGGLGVGDLCGVTAGATAALGCLFIKDHAHESDYIKQLTKEFITKYTAAMGSINCLELKKQHYNPTIQCKNVIIKGAEILDEIVARELNK